MRLKKSKKGSWNFHYGSPRDNLPFIEKNLAGSFRLTSRGSLDLFMGLVWFEFLGEWFSTKIEKIVLLGNE